MTAITTYQLRGESIEALHAMLRVASADCARPYAFTGDGGEMLFDEARVRLPFAESTAGLPVEQEIDGEIFSFTPQVYTGYWLCEVMLAGEEDANLAGLAISQAAASG